jgi:hypothetical protein
MLLAISSFINYIDRGNLSLAAPILKEEIGINSAVSPSNRPGTVVSPTARKGWRRGSTPSLATIIPTNLAQTVS